MNGSDIGLSPGRRQAMIGANAGIFIIRTLGTRFSEILREIHTFAFRKIHLKVSCGKWRPVCLGLNMLIHWYEICYRCLHQTTWLCYVSVTLTRGSSCVCRFQNSWSIKTLIWQFRMPNARRWRQAITIPNSLWVQNVQTYQLFLNLPNCATYLVLTT